jgi:protein involved in polysaccharide export with SLBB domain
VRNRLEFGDFSTGDRIWMLVEAESALTDTFTVRDGPMLSLPLLGDVSLEGVLRAELVDHLTSFVSRFIRNPVVSARSLIPLTVVGGVAAPGFYTVPTDGLFTDALGLAGGPTATAVINEITVERDGEILYGKEFIAQAIIEGRTIDHLSLEAGDQILVPVNEPGGGVVAILTVIGALIAIPVAIVTLTRGN